MSVDHEPLGDSVFYYRESVPSVRGPIEIGFTNASMDLHVGRAQVEGELARLTRACGVGFAQSDQIHGADVIVVDEPGPSPTEVLPQGDALITRRRGFGLMTRVADCVPVVLVDPDTGVLAVVHSGRPGTLLNVVGAAVGRMRSLGARSIRAWVGPSVCGRCYEVPDALREEVSAAVPDTASVTSWGTAAIDLAAGVRGQLVRAEAEVNVVSGCTRENPDLHSFRRDGEASGRCAGVVWTR